MTPTRTPRPAPADLPQTGRPRTGWSRLHPGAVKALKEAGQWTAEQEAHNNALYKRQEVLAVGLGGIQQGQSAFRRKSFPGWLDEDARSGARQGHMQNGFE